MSAAGRTLHEWWRRRTVRFRLALWYAAGGTLLTTLFAITIYTFVTGRIARPLDYALRQDLAELHAGLRIASDRSLRWQGDLLTEGVTPRTEPPWFEVWDDQGLLVRRVWPFAETRAANLPGPPSRTVGDGAVSVFYVAPTLRLRTLTVRVEVPGAPSFWMLRLFTVHERYSDALEDLRIIIAASLPVTVALLVIGGHLLTRRWLLPLDRMAAEANRISVDDLERRLPVENPHDELGRLAQVFNITLDRLQNSFEALDRFVSDASHELRTPLTTLRSVGEVALRKSRTAEEYRTIIGSMLEEVQRLQGLVERLLQLASAEGGGQAVQRVPTALHELAAACVQELSVLAELKRQRLVVSGGPCHTVTDPVLVRQALQNLIDNAIKYGPEDSEIRIELGEQDGQLEIAVSDEGPGISDEDRAQVQERFYRADRARGRDTGGFGLGLAITKAYLRSLGGTLAHEPRTPRGSTFRLLLPPPPSA